MQFPSNPEKRNVRLLIVDDSALVRRELRQLLELSDGLDVVAEAEDGRKGILLTAELGPDVVIMDLEMPGMDGYEATRQIKSHIPAPRVVILSVHAVDTEQKARASGADSIVVKGANYQTMLSAILGKDRSSNSPEKGEKS